MDIRNINSNFNVQQQKTTNNFPKTKPMPMDSVSFSGNIKDNTQQFIDLRDRISGDMKTVAQDVETASWDFYINSTSENMDKMNAAEDRYNDFYDNKDVYAELKSINDNGGVSEKHLKKQLKQLTADFGDGIEFKDELKALSEKENEISQKLNSYQMTLDGKPITKAEISKIMETETDVSVRKKAVDARIKSGDLIADDLVELVKMRNDFAKKKGYDNYFDYKIAEAYDIQPEELDKLLNDVAENTKDSNNKVMAERKKELAEAFGIKPDELRRYHAGFLTGDDPEKLVNDVIESKEDVVDICKKAYLGMGYNVDELPITLDLFPRENKNTHGFSFSIEPGKDARILANLTDNSYSVDTLMHELGHSIFTVKTDPTLPYIEQDTTSTMTEAVAMMMGDLIRTEGLVKDRLTPEVNEKFEKSLGKEESNFIGASMKIIDFERNMYKNPDQDLKKLWKDMSIKYTGSSEQDEATNEWATVPHFLSHPAYYQNYFRASLIKAQLYDALTQKFGNLTENTETADYLNEHLFRYGGSKDDDEILIETTGKKLSADAFCKRVNELVE